MRRQAVGTALEGLEVFTRRAAHSQAVSSAAAMQQATQTMEKMPLKSKLDHGNHVYYTSIQ